MVFTDKKSQSSNHNRLNLRDKSTDPGNLYGDANINASRAQQRGSRGGVRMQQQDTNAELNDRVEEDTDSDDGPPPLEQAYRSPQ